MLEATILTIITAATPLLFAAIGELVTERSGVLNLGVEGMMVMGAVAGFGTALTTGSPLLGILAAALAGMGLALVFAFLTQTLVTNQVASGLALTLFGIGVSGLVGERFVGQPGVRLEKLSIPGLTDLPVVGKILFGQDLLVYLSVALVLAVGHVLFRTRTGLVIRAVGDNHGSAHALGYRVTAVRTGAILFGGACSGLGGGYLSLAYTPQWVENMTAGRGWIALALVVFSSWLPLRAMVGAYLFATVTILGFAAQGFGLGVPAQFLSSLPYLVTIVALVIISKNRLVMRANTPACLGQSFVPDR
ncbi:ABC transporter permease [Prosthecomicrobium sp. N25]|uniref:ABC transporter permease n=1 Tax=Prosthecomicrobium sp. N25 TaxID=3129254 RepID=UPI00307789E6